MRTSASRPPCVLSYSQSSTNSASNQLLSDIRRRATHRRLGILDEVQSWSGRSLTVTDVVAAIGLVKEAIALHAVWVSRQLQAHPSPATVEKATRTGRREPARAYLTLEVRYAASSKPWEELPSADGSTSPACLHVPRQDGVAGPVPRSSGP